MVDSLYSRINDDSVKIDLAFFLLLNKEYEIPCALTVYELTEISPLPIEIFWHDARHRPSKWFIETIALIIKKFRQNIIITTIEKGPFDSFKRIYHFGPIVFSKLLLPSLSALKPEKAVYIDSGFLIHKPFSGYLENLIHNFDETKKPFGILLSPSRRNTPYPLMHGTCAALLTYNLELWRASGYLRNLLVMYCQLEHKGTLLMPEQDLIELTLMPHEIHLIDNFKINVMFLESGYNNILPPKPDAHVSKFFGSKKPWDKQVIHHDKIYFLRCLRKMHEELWLV